MEFGICSYSFHRLLAAGEQDIFKYITDCKMFGAVQLDPWNAHLVQQDEAYLERVVEAAEKAGLLFGCIAVDGAHIYEPTPEARRANRAVAYKWLDVAEKVGARQVRIDAGGREEMPEAIFDIIVEGYHDLIARARDRGIEVLIENHWGPSKIPENTVRILEASPGLGLLFDTNNWAEGRQEDGWQMCAKYARAVHIKTFSFDEEGNALSADIPRAMRLLLEAGYDDCWGIESCPKDGDEYAGVWHTVALMERALEEYDFLD